VTAAWVRFPPGVRYGVGGLGASVVNVMARERRGAVTEVRSARSPPKRQRWPASVAVAFALGVSILLWAGLWFGVTLLIDLVTFLASAH
jgi:hypothetical protein